MLNHCYWYTLNENINLKMFGSGWKECVSNEFKFIFIILSEQKIISSILWKRHFLKEILSDIAQINSIQIYHCTMKYTFHFNNIGDDIEKKKGFSVILQIRGGGSPLKNNSNQMLTKPKQIKWEYFFSHWVFHLPISIEINWEQINSIRVWVGS